MDKKSNKRTEGDLAPGIGKTKALKKWLKKHGYKMKAIRMVKMDPADMVGYLMPPWTVTEKGNQGPFVAPRSWVNITEDARINKQMRDETYGDDKGLTVPQLLEYANVHSQRARDEGLEKTGLVIDWLACAVDRLDRKLAAIRNEASTDIDGINRDEALACLATIRDMSK